MNPTLSFFPKPGESLRERVSRAMHIPLLLVQIVDVRLSESGSGMVIVEYRDKCDDIRVTRKTEVVRV